MSINQRIRKVEERWDGYVDAVFADAASRQKEDAKRHEENGLELQGIVMAAGVLTEDISKAMDMVVENQIAPEHDKYEERIYRDASLARALLDLTVNDLRPFLRPVIEPFQSSNTKYADRPPIKSPATMIRDRPTKLNRNQVPVDRCVVEFPPRSEKFYILDCPICKREFEKVGIFYNHITISHQGILTGQKYFHHALDIGGTLIADADRNWQHHHNAVCKEYVDVSCHNRRGLELFLHPVVLYS